jgi:S-adenosylmethionine:tRNA ribosyltransferase-isomerase
MDVADFDYELPESAIAQEPLAERDASRLLVLRRATGAVEHRVFRELPSLLAPGDLLVMNRSRVIPARLLGRRRGGGAAEVLLVRRRQGASWDALVRPGRRLRAGDVVAIADGLVVHVESEALGPEGRRHVRLESADGGVDAALARHGHVPLPPYIRRPDRPGDHARYQTVYAREEGSVAAPTAGLHFTPRLLLELERAGIGRAELVLHVGPGTFRPVSASDVSAHRLEAEPFWLPAETAAAVGRTRASGGRVVAVGTTSARVLEARASDAGVAAGEGETDLVIVPGHRFRALDALLTNFHLPRSSLLLLAAAFGGREAVLAAYGEALRRGYRFYSYGDAMLIV